ncbi:hypothetical protein ARMGADRAFT_1061887 [Armillaria gallica]|uniref:Uncharacterized protein n=1 Tax=Armillaria gallica TaxID=47427 RepID=A0A2H3E6A1_ARMGA|nr:hypothetical protein ARMGADRAFT_1061887 [Armillaria gallica]
MYTNSMWAPCSGCPCPNHHLPSCTFTAEPSLSDDPEWMHLSRSNNPPSQYEEMVLSTLISAYDEQIQGIDLETSSLEAFSLSLKAQIVTVSQKIEALRQEHARVTEAARDRQDLLSPVRRLPREVLNHIFLNAIDFPVQRTQIVMTGEEDDQEADSDHEEDVEVKWDFKPPGSSLWSFMEVSTQWRSVCLSSPRLWSYVNIIITESNFKDHSYIRQLGRQLDLSAKYPLSISICRIVKEFAPQVLPPQLVAIFFSFSSCIRELHLYLTPYILSQMSDMRLSLPSLEYVVLLFQDGVYPTTDHLRLFSSTPKLQSLEVIDWQDGLELPWNQLKKYHSDWDGHRNIWFNCPETHHHLNTLRKLQQVEECVLRLGNVSDEDELGDEVYPLIIPQLRMLDLSSWNSDHSTDHSVFPQVADRLVLPALSVLKVACSQAGNYETQDVFASIYRLLQRSQSHITVLHFDHGLVLAEDLLELFSSTPTLEDLRLSRIGYGVFTDQVAEKLTLDHASSSEDLILPHLCTLYIPGGGGLTVSGVVRMVQSRRINDNSRRFDRLQTLRLYGNFLDPSPAIDKTISRLKQYYAEGFSFGTCRIVY